MRAGLLSQPQVIQRLNEEFVSTSIAIAELEKMVQTGDKLAREVIYHWQYPVNLMFLTVEGRFVTKLSSLTDLTDVHPDTQCRPTQTKDPASALNNSRVFLKHVDRYFGANPPAVKR